MNNIKNITAWAVLYADGSLKNVYRTREEARLNRIPRVQRIVRMRGDEVVR